MSPNLTHLEIKAMELESTIESLSSELLKQKKELNELRLQIEKHEKRLEAMQEEKSQSAFSSQGYIDEKPPHY